MALAAPKYEERKPSVDPSSGLDAEGKGVKVRTEGLREATKKALEAFDTDGDGIEVHELLQAAEKWRNSKGDLGSFKISAFPDALHDTLAAFDQDGDGTVSKGELVEAAKMYADTEREQRRLRIAIVGLFSALVLTIIVIFGLTFAVVEMAKETKTETTGVMKVAGSDTPTGTASVVRVVTLTDLAAMSAEAAGDMDKFTLDLPGGGQAAYKVNYVKKRATMVLGLQGGGRLEILNASVGKLTETGTNTAKYVCLQTGGCQHITQYHRHQVMGRRTHVLADGTPSTSMGSCTVKAAAASEGSGLPDTPLCPAAMKQCFYTMPAVCPRTPPPAAGNDTGTTAGAEMPPPFECEDCDMETEMCHKCVPESWGACPGTPGGPDLPECTTSAAPRLCRNEGPKGCTGTACYGSFYCALECSLQCESGQVKCKAPPKYGGKEGCLPAARGCPPIPPECGSGMVFCREPPRPSCPPIDGVPCWPKFSCMPESTGCPPPPTYCPSDQKVCSEPPPPGMKFGHDFCHPASEACPPPPVICGTDQVYCSGSILENPGPDFCMPMSSGCPVPAGQTVALTATQAAQQPNTNSSTQFRHIWHLRRAKAAVSSAVSALACDLDTQVECHWPAPPLPPPPTAEQAKKACDRMTPAQLAAAVAERTAKAAAAQPKSFCAPISSGCPPPPLHCNDDTDVHCTRPPPPGCNGPACYPMEFCAPKDDGCPPQKPHCDPAMGLVPCHEPPPPGCESGPCKHGHSFCAQMADGCPPLPLQCHMRNEKICTGTPPTGGGPAPEWCENINNSCPPPPSAGACASGEMRCPGDPPTCHPMDRGCPPPPVRCSCHEVECHSTPPPGCTMGSCMPPPFCAPMDRGCPIVCGSGMHTCHSPHGPDTCMPHDTPCPVVCGPNQTMCTDGAGTQTCVEMSAGCPVLPPVCASGQHMCSHPAPPDCQGNACAPHNFCVSGPCPPPPLHCTSQEVHCRTCTVCPCHGEGAAPWTETCMPMTMGCPMEPPCCTSSQMECSMPPPPMPKPPPCPATGPCPPPPPMPMSMTMPHRFCVEQSVGCPRPPVYCNSDEKFCGCPPHAPSACAESCMPQNGHCPIWCASDQVACADHWSTPPGGQYCHHPGPMNMPCPPAPVICSRNEVNCWTHCPPPTMTCPCPAMPVTYTCPCPGTGGGAYTCACPVAPPTNTCACPCHSTEYCHSSPTRTCPPPPNMQTMFPMSMYPSGGTSSQLEPAE